MVRAFKTVTEAGKILGISIILSNYEEKGIITFENSCNKNEPPRDEGRF